MTKREALHELYTIFGYGFYNERVDEALNMAIKALEQEQQRQEDIYECQYCFGEVHKNYIYCPFCGKRIEALEQEETLQNLTKPNKSDLISRQAAIDAVHSYFKDKLDGLPTEETEEGYEVYCDMDKIDAFLSDNKYLSKRIENLPTAQPFTEEQIQTMQELESAQLEKAYELGKADRPKGHWIETAQAYYEMINEKGGGVDENTPYFIDDIACSECLAKFSVIDNETERFDFCPNCGCLMKGADDE